MSSLNAKVKVATGIVVLGIVVMSLWLLSQVRSALYSP